MSYPPTLDSKRAMLTQARDDFRAKGYAAELNIEALRVQDAGDDESIEEQIKKYEHSRDNCYKAARRMDEMLSKLPKPKTEKAK